MGIRGRRNRTTRLTSAGATIVILGLPVLFHGWPSESGALAGPVEPYKPPHQKLFAPPIADVQIADEFWAPRIKTCREVTLPYCFEVCEATGRIGNFAKAAGLAEGGFEGIHFNDSDVYKVVEGTAYSLATHPEATLEKLTDDVIRKIAAAQQPDGYLFCYFILGDPHERWKHIHQPARHEMYCMGHAIEAGVAHSQMTGRRDLLDVASKLADHVGSVFGPGKRVEVPEHQELELALIQLYRVTGEKRYLELARFFIDQRGVADGRTLHGLYAQDHQPVRKQSEIVGHAVRAMYQCIGMADLYAETGDEELLAACRRLWESTVHRKMYITGGVGARAHGEAFGDDYELPNETAYAETCAAIGLAFFAHRMFLIDPQAEYADVLERVLYNGFLSGVSLSGTEFFYQNRLATRGDYHRQPWYACACCPSNVVRVFPKIGRYVYACDDSSIYVNLYVGGAAKIPVGGTVVQLRQETRYPWEGDVTLTVTPDEATQFDLLLRIPRWCRGPSTPGGLYRMAPHHRLGPFITVWINDKLVDLEAATYAEVYQRGYLRLSRRWTPGDRLRLSMPMQIRRMHARPEVEADAGRVAIQRGPIVYCVEGVDHGGRVAQLAVPAGARFESEHRPDLLGGVTVITGKAVARQADSDELQPVDLMAVPYYAWDNREGSEMAVWLPEDPALAAPVPKPTIASRATPSASHCWQHDTVAALNDQIEPRSSHDLGVPRHTWWNHRGTKEWVQYDFAAPRKVSGVEVYWFDDRATGGCWVPDSWRVLARVGETWQPVSGVSEYGVKPDRFNRVTFDCVETTSLRLEVELRPNCSGGVLEWRVEGPDRIE